MNIMSAIRSLLKVDLCGKMQACIYSVVQTLLGLRIFLSFLKVIPHCPSSQCHVKTRVNVLELQVEVATIFIIHGVNHSAVRDYASCYRDRRHAGPPAPCPDYCRISACRDRPCTRAWGYQYYPDKGSYL